MAADLPLPYAPIRCSAPLCVGETIRLNRVMVRALRFREVNPSEAFTIEDAGGLFFRARLLGTSPTGGEALIYEQMPRSPESPVRITLLCAVLARQRMFEVIRKATELGAMRVVPILTERSVAADGLEHEKAHAWPRVAIRASRQCRRASVPEVRSTIPLAEALGDPVWSEADLRLYLDDRASSPHHPTTTPSGGQASPPHHLTISLASGPEGGWTDEEHRLLEDAGAQPLVLGGRILRAETAPIVALTLLQHSVGDLVTSSGTDSHRHSKP